MIAQSAAFLGISALVIVTPGQDTALTIRNALLGGRRAALFTALGVSAGQALWALASAAGVAALLQASEPTFVAIRVAGAAYLVWLTAYGAAVARAGDFLRRSRVRRALDAAMGVVLVALGLRIAGEAR